MGDGQVAVLVAVTQVLDRLGIAYAIVGSLASSVHGIPRYTRDFDLIADLRPEHVGLLVSALESDFYIDSNAVKEAIQRRASFNVIHLESMFKVDIFARAGDPLSSAQMSRSVSQDIAGEYLKVVSAEDVVVSKLRWFRDGGEVSERQWRDVLEVIAVQAERLDMAYMCEMALELRVADLLDKALAEAATDPQSSASS
jgi:hypothetical protein